MLTTKRYPVCVGLILAGLLPLALAGCDGRSIPTYRAGGKVVFPDGQPLVGGWVWFESVQGAHIPGARGQIQPDGLFHLTTYRSNDGAVEGEYRALVAPPLPEGASRDLRAVPMIIDPRYSQFETSGLKFTVSRDPTKNQFTIQVARPGK